MLKYQVESLDGIDEAAQGFYKEADGGGYVLQVEGAVSQSRFNEVNQKAVDNATEAQRRRRTVERTLEALGIDSADELDSTIEALKSNKGKGNADHEAIVKQLKDEYEGKLSASEKRYQDVVLSGAVSEVKSALVEVGFPAKIADMLAKTSKDRLTIDESGKIRIMADNGNPLAGSGSDGYATYGDFAKEFAAATPELLTDKGKGGGGKPPASNGNNQGGNSVFSDIPGFNDLPIS